MQTEYTNDDVLKCVSEADSLAKDPSNIFKKITDNKLSRLTLAYEKYAQAINLSLCLKDKSKLLELSEKKLDVVKRTPEVSSIEIAHEYIKLAELQEKIDNTLAIKSYLQAINLFSNQGEFNRRQKYLMKVAKLYDTNGDKDLALKYYCDAVDSDVDPNKARIEIARINAEQKNYNIATTTYEIVMKDYADNSLLKFSSKEYFLKCVLCGICWMGLDYKKTFDEYVQSYVIFQNTMEFNLLDKIFLSLETSDADIFHTALVDYDGIKHFDDLNTNLLLHIKNKVLLKDELL